MFHVKHNRKHTRGNTMVRVYMKACTIVVSVWLVIHMGAPVLRFTAGVLTALQRAV